MLWQVDVGYYCAGLETDDGPLHVVLRAAPVLRWAVGRNLSAVQRWVESKKGTCVLVGST